MDNKESSKASEIAKDIKEALDSNCCKEGGLIEKDKKIGSKEIQTEGFKASPLMLNKVVSRLQEVWEELDKECKKATSIEDIAKILDDLREISNGSEYKIYGVIAEWILDTKLPEWNGDPSEIKEKEEDVNINTFQECSECSKKSGLPALCPGCLSNRSVISFLKKTIEMKDITIKRLREERNKRVDNTELGIISERLEEDNYAKEASLVRSLMHQVEDDKEDEYNRKENDKYEMLKKRTGELKDNETSIIESNSVLEIPVLCININISDKQKDLVKQAIINRELKVLAFPNKVKVSKIVFGNLKIIDEKEKEKRRKKENK
jgi:hypothetical protein